MQIDEWMEQKKRKAEKELYIVKTKLERVYV